MTHHLPSRSARLERSANVARFGTAAMGLALLALTLGMQTVWDVAWINTERTTFVSMGLFFGVLALIAWGGAWQMRHTLIGK